MTLPKDDLAVEIAPGADITQDPSTWTWVDLCAHADEYPDGRVQWPINIQTGRSSEGAQASPSSCSFDVRNEDGALSPDNPMGPWYGRLGLNTPLRVTWGSSERFLGLISELPTSWLGLVANSRSAITANGSTRRLQQGAQALSSALVRTFQRNSRVIAYWPCEDAAGATEAASPLKGTNPISVDPNYVEFGAGDDIPAGSAPGLMKIAAGSPSVMGQVPTVASNLYRILLLTRLDEPTTDVRTLLTVETTSTKAALWRVRASSTQIQVEVRDNDGGVVLTDTQGIDTAFFGGWSLVTLTIQASGSGVAWSYSTQIPDAGLTTLNSDSGTLASTSLGRVTRAGAYAGTAQAIPAERYVGHITVVTTLAPASFGGIDLAAVHGFTGEHAGVRFERLCDEEALPYVLVGDAADTMPMGPQQQEELTAVFQSIQDADGGILHDLTYRTRTNLYNQTPAWDLDFCDLNGSPEPLYDDQAIRNDVTASRPNGSSAQITDDAHIEKYGRYSDTPSANVERDGLLDLIAAWLVHLGTVEAMRWPNIPISINKETQHLLADWLTLNVGDRLTIPHDIPQLPGIDIDLLVEGWTEVIQPYRAEITLNCRPAQPWTVFELEHPTRGRLTSSRAYLGEDIDSTDTTFNVIVPVQRPFNTVPGFEEPITVLNFDDPFDDPPAYDWSDFGGTLVRSTEQAFRGKWSGKFTPNGTSSFPIVRMYTPQDAAAAGRTYSASAWVYAPTGGFQVNINIRFTRSDSTIISTVTGTLATLTSGTWTRLYLQAVAPVGTNRFSSGVFYNGTPSASSVIYIDDGEIGAPGAPWTTNGAHMPFDITIGGEVMAVTGIFAALNGVQQFVCTRSVNGVVKSHSAGSPVALHPGHVISL